MLNVVCFKLDDLCYSGSVKLGFRKRFKNFITALGVGFFLAVREIRRGNKWATMLIVAVMVLTFLNLVVISGVLVGLIEGSTNANRDLYTSDVLISSFKDRSYIEQTTKITKYLEGMPEVVAISPRYLEGATLEANYKTTRKPTELINSAAGLVAGIDPKDEDLVTGISSKIVEGEYLEHDDYDMVVVGANLLDKYLPIDSPGLLTLRGVEVGSKVRLTVNGYTREVIIKGVIKSKVDVDMRVLMVDSQLRNLLGRNDYNVDEIAVKLQDPDRAGEVVSILKKEGFDRYARIQSWEDAQPKFLQDIKATFAILGNVISTIGLAVAAITIFIVIFVNAITRRRYIGILKGIGINTTAIEFSYILQSLFYAGVGMIIGSLIVFGLLKPFIAAHPINFPFSDGILVATASGTTLRGAVLFFATMIAGYIPAKLVVRQNTLDAILGR
jgi:putative ABC transport system permease protein